MLSRHRRRQNALYVTEPGRSRLWVRLGIVVLVLVVVWYIVSQVFSLFESALGRGTGAVLTIRGEGVDVSLQDADWQRAETNLKLYPGDAVLRRAGGEAMITFFDGTKLLLDLSTEVSVDRSTLEAEGTSQIAVTVKSGRVFVSTPAPRAFTGSITRSMDTSNFSASVPSDTAAVVGAALVHVVRASGLGITLSLTFADRSVPDLTIGEGQYIAFTDAAKAAIDRGEDPYGFRDPATEELRRDPFLVASLSRSVETVGRPTTPSGGTGSVALPVLSVDSPTDRQKVTTPTFRVSGRVGDAVSLVLVNGQAVSLGANRAFSLELSIGSGPTTAVRIEAQDAQGIPLAIVERTVENSVQVAAIEPVRIKSPVASGATFTTSAVELEITGEAAAATQGIQVNDYKLQLYKPGARTWSYLASIALGNMKAGPNLYTVYALDAAGNRSPGRSITIVYEPQSTGTGAVSQPPLKQNPPLTPGVLVVTAPEAGTTATVTQTEAVIEGRTSPETQSISVNGYTLSLYKPGVTTWNYIASTELQTMKRGKNVYRIVARNASGEILDVLEYTIDFRP